MAAVLALIIHPDRKRSWHIFFSKDQSLEALRQKRGGVYSFVYVSLSRETYLCVCTYWVPGTEGLIRRRHIPALMEPTHQQTHFGDNMVTVLHFVTEPSCQHALGQANLLVN